MINMGEVLASHVVEKSGADGGDIKVILFHCRPCLEVVALALERDRPRS